MIEVGLLEAWRLWFSGNLTSDSLLWGVMKILWWGRIGKVIVLAAALTIVVDIIGPERLRSFGESLHTKKFAMTAALDFLRESLRWYKKLFRYVWKDNTFPFVAYHGSTEEDLRTAIHEFKADKLNYFVCLVLTVIGLCLTRNTWLKTLSSGEWWWVLAGASIMYIVILIMLSPVVTLIIVATPTIIGQSIDYALVKPLAWMLDRPHIDKLVKIAGVLLLLIGFHFDLLAS